MFVDIALMLLAELGGTGAELLILFLQHFHKFRNNSKEKYKMLKKPTGTPRLKNLNPNFLKTAHHQQLERDSTPTNG